MTVSVRYFNTCIRVVSSCGSVYLSRCQVAALNLRLVRYVPTQQGHKGINPSNCLENSLSRTHTHFRSWCTHARPFRVFRILCHDIRTSRVARPVTSPVSSWRRVATRNHATMDAGKIDRSNEGNGTDACYLTVPFAFVIPAKWSTPDINSTRT